MDNLEIVQKVAKEVYYSKLKNRLFGLLKEREKNGEWEKFLDNIIIELMQFDEDKRTINYYRLMERLLKMKYLRFGYFRSLIFECMNLLDNIGDA